MKYKNQWHHHCARKILSTKIPEREFNTRFINKIIFLIEFELVNNICKLNFISFQLKF